MEESTQNENTLADTADSDNNILENSAEESPENNTVNEENDTPPAFFRAIEARVIGALMEKHLTTNTFFCNQHL